MTDTLDLFSGPSYEPEHDHARLSRQLDRVRDFMLGHGRWMTVPEISEALNEPATSVSAQLRNLRKASGGGYHVPKRRRGNRSNGLYEFMVEVPLGADMEGAA